MNFLLTRRSVLLSLIAGAAVAPVFAQTSRVAAPEVFHVSPPPAVSPHDKAVGMISKAIVYLRASQDKKTGGWCIQEGAPVFPAITGLVVQGMLMEPGIGDDDATVQQAVKFMLDSQQQDGGIYAGLLPSYNTAICLTALAKVNSPPQVVDARKRALEFLRTIQYGEGAAVYEEMQETAQKVDKDHPYYGGFGYGNHGRPDMSNTTFAVEAMHAMQLPDNDPAYQRAIVFLQRCQMQEAAGGKGVNDRAYAKGSTQGGFIYSTSVNKDNIGIGQSPAGEVAEDLSGGPGLAATIVLKQKGPDGKPVTLTRAQIIERIEAREQIDAHREIAGLGRRFVIVFGQTSDGERANAFSIRADVQVEGSFTSMLGMAFADVLDNAKDVVVTKVDSWNGIPRHRAYGTMTYAGLKSYLYAGLSKTDPRVQAARGWIGENYTLEYNPGGMGTDGLYYYYLMFSRTFDALGDQMVAVRTADGKQEQRDWAKDLIDHLATLQNEDGSFRSVDDRWMESNPVLITAYSLIALESAARE